MEYPNNYYRVVEIVKIYDGDTITLIIDLGFKITKEVKVRLLGIDTPELRGVERPEGLKSRDFLINLLEDKTDIRLITKGKDKKGKYGRYLGTILIHEDGVTTDVNSLMIISGMAKVYS